MDIIAEREQQALIVKPEGRLDGNNSYEFHKSFNSVVTDDDSVIIMDLSDLTYISSAGLRVFLLIARALKQQNKKIMLCSANNLSQKVFQVSGIDKIITVYDTQEEALNSLLQ